MFNECTWLYTPPECQIDQDALKVVTSENTDFWRITQYDFIHDNGHFFGPLIMHLPPNCMYAQTFRRCMTRRG
jgi:regulation of enolase protein 1 (concanavalin A-like superfamily)